MSYKVKLEYFKPNGKYYADGEYVSEKQHLFEIWKEVDEMARRKDLPGLVKGSSEFIISIDVPEHVHRHPHLTNVRESIKEWDKVESSNSFWKDGER